jgi:hypothetical protein
MRERAAVGLELISELPSMIPNLLRLTFERSRALNEFAWPASCRRDMVDILKS